MASAIEAPATMQAEGQTSHTLFQAARPANTFGYTREQQIEALHKLREPFAPAEIRYLPRVWCGACKNSPRGKSCQHHPITKCGKCGQRMPNGGHIDLAYVGHAEATNRLLNVDPFWDWEPLTVDERGLPQVDGYRGLWIRLTVCGMTRLGYGHAGDKTGGDAVKEVIGDAIRNAGMRFGMALDLWTSSDLEIIESGGESLEQDAPAPSKSQSAPRPPAAVPQSRQESRPAPQQPAPTQSAPAPDADADPLARLVAQYQDPKVWDNPLALSQIRLEGRKREVSDRSVQGPPPGNAWTTFDALLESRIKELEAAKDGATERSAA